MKWIILLLGLTPKVNSPSGTIIIPAGLTEHEVKELIATINSIHAEGTSIIWIEHIVHALLSVVSRLIVINFGQKLDDGNPKIVIQSPEVQKVYMGISVE